MSWLRRRYRCSAQTEPFEAMRQWYLSPLGEELRHLEQAQLGELLGGLFGYHLVQVGRTVPADLLLSSRVRHRVILDTPVVAGSAGSADGLCVGSPEALPIASDSVDVVVLHHVLELLENPHQLLREVERVVIPEGHVVIGGFNPWSLWGLARSVLGWRGRLPWCLHFYSLTRIKDWLALLGFETAVTRQLFYRPPLRHGGLLARLFRLEAAGERWWRPFGGAYVLVARKRTTTLTPLRPRWRPRRSLLANGLVKPTMYGEKFDNNKGSG